MNLRNAENRILVEAVSDKIDCQLCGRWGVGILRAQANDEPESISHTRELYTPCEYCDLAVCAWAVISYYDLIEASYCFDTLCLASLFQSVFSFYDDLMLLSLSSHGEDLHLRNLADITLSWVKLAKSCFG